MENITTRPQIVKFKRGVNLILGQYRYKKDGKYKEKQHWRCTIVGQGCRGRLHTTGDGENLEVVHQVEHNHMPDIDLSGDYSLTLDQQQFLLHQDANILIFATEPNLRLLSNAETIYMDGTFKASPQIFEQLYSIHATYRGHVVPVVYALLPDKLRETYHTMFDILKRKMALAFLPTDQIMGIFTTLQQQPVVEGNNQLQALFTYYYDTWLTGPFPLELWNVHQTSTRTNNMVEGWHSRLNRYVRRLHPNLHQLVKELQKEQAMTQVTVQRARLGGAPPARRMKYVRIDEEVQRLTHKFDLDEITPMEYISGLRRVIHHY